MNDNSVCELVERWCLGCRRSVYQVPVVGFIVEIVQALSRNGRCTNANAVWLQCALSASVMPKLATTGLVKVILSSILANSTEVEQRIRPQETPQPASEPAVVNRAVTSSMRVKRKHIAATINSSAVPGPQVATQTVSGANAAKNGQKSASFPATTSLAVSRASQGNYQLPSSPTPLMSPRSAPIAQFSQSPFRPGLTGHAQTELPLRHVNLRSTTDRTQVQRPTSQQRPQQRPQVQHLRTAPQLPVSRVGASQNQRPPTNQRGSGNGRLGTLANNRKSMSNVFSIATARKVAQNKWVRSGAKIGANIVMKAVVGDIASGFLNSDNNDNDNDNNDDNSNNAFSNTTGDDGGDLAQDDENYDLQDTQPDPNGADPGTGDDVAGTDYNYYSDPTNISRQVDIGSYDAGGYGGVGYDNYDPTTAMIDPTATFYSPDPAYDSAAAFNNPDATSTDPNAGFVDPNTYDPTAAFNSLGATPTDPNAGFVDPNTYLGNGYGAVYADPSQGGQDDTADYDNAQQQLQIAQEGLPNAQENQNMAVNDGANNAIDVSNTFQDDEVAQPDQSMAWPSAAVPGVAVEPSYDDGDDGMIPGLAV